MEMKKKILTSFSLSFLISGVYFFEFINYHFVTYTGLFYKKNEVVISFLVLHLLATSLILIFLTILEKIKNKTVYLILNKLFKIGLFFFFIRIFVKSTGYPGLIYLVFKQILELQEHILRNI